MADPQRVSIEGSPDCLVLSDYMQATPDDGNLARVRKDGSEAWRVTPGTKSQDAWVAVETEAGRAYATTWSGWRVVLDLETGRELGRAFTK